jgi:hypothetical protein
VTTRHKQIGAIAIDSGQLLLVDPCNVELAAQAAEGGSAIASKTHLTFPLSSSVDGAILITTGYGDGLYPVYAEIRDGRIMRVIIDFNLKNE